jgi:anti-sigma B factor antagonist
MEVSIDTTSVGGATVVKAAGEVDVFTAPQLREALGVATDGENRQVIVDLEDVDFLDSTGLGVLVFGLKRIRERGGDLSVVCRHEQILKVLNITGLSKILQVHASLEDAAPARA